jgi:hypothetical protein
MEAYVKYKLTDKNLFTIESRSLARRYNLLVGNERVSSIDLVAKLLGEEPVGGEEVSPTTAKAILKAPDQFSHFYLHKLLNQNNIKEPFARAYLQASCFVEIVQRVLKEKKI